MKNRILVIASIAALVIGITVFALAQGPGMHGHGRGEGQPRKGPFGPEMIEHLTRELNLTEAQQAQIKTIIEAAQAASEPLAKKMDEVHKQLEAATANGQFDEAQVRALANQQGQIMAETIVEHERAKSKVYSVLTAEQRVKADEMHKRMGPHHPPGPPKGPPPPPPSE